MLGKIREIKLCLQWTYFRRILVIGNHCGDKHVRSDKKNLFNRKTIVVIISKIVVSFFIICCIVFNFIVGNNFVFLIWIYVHVLGIFAWKILNLSFAKSLEVWKLVFTIFKLTRFYFHPMVFLVFLVNSILNIWFKKTLTMHSSNTLLRNVTVFLNQTLIAKKLCLILI